MENSDSSITNHLAVELISNRVKLLPFDSLDMDLFIELSMCPIIMEHVSKPFTLTEAQSSFYERTRPWSISSDGWLTLSINKSGSGEKLGNIALRLIDREARIAEVGFMIKRNVQRRGFASEALGLMTDYAFNQLKLNKLVAVCSAANTGSCKLLEKSGFIREALLRNNAFINHSYIDDYRYGLTSPFG